METSVLIWLLAIPLIATLAVLPMRSLGKHARTAVETIHLLGVSAMLVVVLIVVGMVLSAGYVETWHGWLRVDAMGALFVLIVGIVGFLAGIYSIGYARDELKSGEMDLGRLIVYYSLFHFFIMTMLLVVASNNIIIMWVALEATTLSSAFLVGMHRTRSALEAAWKYVVICTVGVAFGLYGTILVYANAVNVMQETGAASLWSEIVKNAAPLDPVLLKLAFVFVLVGFGTKAGIFPMFSWLPDAHSEAPSPVSALLSAVLLNCALFIVIRFSIIVNVAVGPEFIRMLFLVFGMLSVGAAVFFMLLQKDIKRLLAYSSTENIGLILLAFGLGGPIGALAGFLQLLNHSLVKSMMFFLSGNLLIKYRSRDLNVIKGLMQAAPMTSVLMLGGVFALAGAPPFSIFFSKFMIVTAGIATGHLWLMVAALLLIMLAFVALVKMASSVVMGDKPADIAKGETSFATLAPIVVLMLLILGLGLGMPGSLTALLNSAAGIVNTGLPVAQSAGAIGFGP